ncbi:F-box/FBD/LRR-repeat protein At1g13570-like [Olea europaea var. sylvestris]|uniref:F-box FBD LRR-repeat At1g13570-like n=1 Tax=Olea europaea subsp. europaea TaxID=158383 RepID=A0A8S0PWC1_OLEEU|nr:F-box/FBD/LRR-repeat protein At1g13570-like [Olea europaea var. sylvestris]CAA2958252.1 F-box FBD LRR-repeat At1g13570-like [Olea europaea subsp. europaea]
MRTIGRSEADLISNLPCSIIENILGCLPLRDAVRTSILSREWRYKWITCPELVFDFWFDQMFLGNHKLEMIIYQILRLHQGPLLKFALQVPDFRSCPDVDQWIDHLPNNNIQDFTLHISRGDKYVLPSRLFAFQQLRNLKLYKCAFNPPPGFKGFSKLVNLDLQNVELDPVTFAKFVALCPNLESLRLMDCTGFECLEINASKLKFLEFHGVFKSVSFKNCSSLAEVKLSFSSMDFKTGNRFSFDLIKSLSCLPALEELHLQAYVLEDLTEFGAPKKLPMALKTLKTLHLSDMYFEKIEEISCAICLIRSSPNLQKLKITAFTFDVVEAVAEFLRAQKISDGSMTQLKTVDMQLFSGIESEMEFVKYLLASATALEEMAISPHAGSVSDGGESILNELKQFPRASPKAEIINSEKKGW